MTEEKKFDDGGAAFPQQIVWDDEEMKKAGGYKETMGMSLLDYFAGLAMQTLLKTASQRVMSPFGRIKFWIGCDSTPMELRYHQKGISEKAYKMAEAMIAERNKRGAE